MKVKMLVARAGLGFSNMPGEVADIEDGEAKRLIDSGQAEAAEPEKATAPLKRKRKPTTKDNSHG